MVVTVEADTRSQYLAVPAEVSSVFNPVLAASTPVNVVEAHSEGDLNCMTPETESST